MPRLRSMHLKAPEVSKVVKASRAICICKRTIFLRLPMSVNTQSIRVGAVAEVRANEMQNIGGPHPQGRQRCNGRDSQQGRLGRSRIRHDIRRFQLTRFVRQGSRLRANSYRTSPMFLTAELLSRFTDLAASDSHKPGTHKRIFLSRFPVSGSCTADNRSLALLFRNVSSFKPSLGMKSPRSRRGRSSKDGSRSLVGTPM